MRVLKVRRISRDTESSSSLDRQNDDQDAALAGTGCPVVGDVVDATVSGSVNLADRKSLGKWMREPLWNEWDAIMLTALDRITRDQWHWEQFAQKCHEAGKEIICLDDPSLDIHTSDGRLIAYVKASQAQKFRETISNKRKNQTASFRNSDLWGGGAWPFGYRPVPVEQDDGKLRYKLFLDPVTSKLVRQAYERLVLEGWSMGKVVRDWNQRGILTPKDHQRNVNATEKKANSKAKVRGSKWQTSSLGAILRKPTLKGVAMHKGAPLLRKGQPARWAEPILTDQEFDQLQTVLEKLSSSRSGIRGNSDPTSGPFLCPCGVKQYPDKRTNKQVRNGEVIGTRTSYYYRCGSRTVKGEACGYQASWPKDLLLQELESGFLHRIGDKEVMARTWVPGIDNRKQIKELKLAHENLMAAIKAASNPVVLTSLTESMEENQDLLTKLEAEPYKPGHWAEHGTGETYRQKWERMPSWDDRGPFLHRSGFRLISVGLKEMDGPLFVLVAPTEIASTEGTEYDSKEYDQSVHRTFRKTIQDMVATHQESQELKNERHMEYDGL
ncbi:recombinase family protein [Streptomyces sp. NPDC059037]|uniref:recombinase family protein n=1 Tax=Streptomyces sp. NPDC059037 TaxID=3346710 RepID=UPI0036AE7852